MRLLQQGATLAWLIVTGISEQTGWTSHEVKQREGEISQITKLLGFSRVFNLNLPTTLLDTIPMADMVRKFSAVFEKFEPEQLYLPNPSDVHTDHRIVFEAGAACSKWFRHSSVRRVLTYETLSETEFSLEPGAIFRPNYFVDISEYLERKLEVMAVYQSELGSFPFPRSTQAIRALANVRGAKAGFHAAEAFQLLLERF
jgi:LmbE family N-acetylglucosaminyl deacetylase